MTHNESDTFTKRLQSNNKFEFREGLRDAIPIGLGYLAVAFTLGIAARKAGISPFQGFLAGLLNNASAGEYAGFVLISAGGAYLEMVIVILIANARYILMSFAMSQKIPENLPWYHRLIIGFDLTDELFALSIARREKLNPYYFYGAMLMSMPFWAIGTVIGILAGQVLPDNLVSAFSVALYGMFIAIIVPPARKNIVLGFVILISFISSFAASKLEPLSNLSAGTRIIILTVVISTIFALLFPVKNKTNEDKENENNSHGKNALNNKYESVENKDTLNSGDEKDDIAREVD